MASRTSRSDPQRAVVLLLSGMTDRSGILPSRIPLRSREGRRKHACRSPRAQSGGMAGHPAIGRCRGELDTAAGRSGCGGGVPGPLRRREPRRRTDPVTDRGGPAQIERTAPTATPPPSSPTGPGWPGATATAASAGSTGASLRVRDRRHVTTPRGWPSSASRTCGRRPTGAGPADDHRLRPRTRPAGRVRGSGTSN